ncbi:MAG TPA: vanadium-dependent haloperoxidase [Acidimicrobiia bacterium]|nr:vanadium-dependent haloperoxidase [Acidimicrobiia bacterium]
MSSSRRVVLGLVLTLFALPLGPATATSTSTAVPGPNPVLRWNGVLLDAIRSTTTPPTIGSRALAIVHTCMYDAWAAYDPVAVGTRLGGTLRQPPEERTLEARNEAISRSAHLAVTDLYPALRPRFDAVLSGEGYDPAEPPADGTPGGVAVRACRAVLDFRHHDGANQLGDEPGTIGGPYSDYTGYRPVNGPDQVADPDRWQPLRVPDGHGSGVVQKFLTPQWGRIVPFAAGERDLLPADPGPARSGSPVRQAEVDDTVRLSAGLGDEEKVIAEYWADGPGSELPPGHWMRFAEFCSRRDALGIDSDVKLYFLLANAMLDAGIATWDRKVHFDAIRPISLVRLTYAGRPIRAWGGPYQGPREIDGSQWRPYLPTPPFAEYPSGHSTFSAAGAEVLHQFTGRSDFGATVVIPAGASHVEPGAVPAHDVVLHWATFDDAADQAGLSRRLGGIHFLTGDLAGRLVGRRVATRVVARGREFFTGRPS